MLHLLLLLLLSLLLPHSTTASTVLYNLTITSVLSNPDCHLRSVLAINSLHPGPTIHLKQNDQLVVRVCNQLMDSGISLHWHGLHQIGTPFYDGVSGITQCAIQPHECLEYRMHVVGQSGAFFYHAHHAQMSADGAHGAIVVYDGEEVDDEGGGHGHGDHAADLRNLNTTSNEASSDSSPATTTSSIPTFLGIPILPTTFELPLLLTDWYHSHSSQLTSGLFMPGSAFRWVGEPNSILLNGKGTYCAEMTVGTNRDEIGRTAQCTEENKGLTVPVTTLLANTATCGHPVITIPSCSTSITTSILFHIINSASLSYLTLEIEDHWFEVIGTDGMAARSRDVNQQVKVLEINTGERYDVLLHRNPTSTTTCKQFYWLRSTGMYRVNQPTLYGVLQYQDGVPDIDTTTNSSSTTYTFPPIPTFIYPIPAPSLANAPTLYLESGMRTYDNVKNVSTFTPFSFPPELTSPDFTPNSSLILIGKQERIGPSQQMKWTINGRVNVVPSTPSYLKERWRDVREWKRRHSNATVSSSTDTSDTEEDFSSSSSVIDLWLNEWYEIILQNTHALNGICEQHAWHLHGMHTWLVDRGAGTYSSSSTSPSPPLNLTYTLAKDSWTVYPLLNTTSTSLDAARTFPFVGPPGTGCGWTRLRFQANNIGIWLLHCHIIWHASMGMSVVVRVRDPAGEKLLPKLPDDMNVCGDVKLLRKGNAMEELFSDPSPTPSNNNSTNNNSTTLPPGTTPTTPTNPLSWYDYLGPAFTVIAVIVASFMT